MKREAFNKTLIEQPVVRHRLAKAGALLETQQAWIEQFAYAMTKLSKAEADQKLGGLTALAKANGGMVIAHCAEVATLLFGGNGYTKSSAGDDTPASGGGSGCRNSRPAGKSVAHGGR